MVDESIEEEKCPECFGRTIQFSGQGKNMQYRICGRWQEPGHLTEIEIQQRLHAVRMSINQVDSLVDLLRVAAQRKMRYDRRRIHDRTGRT